MVDQATLYFKFVKLMEDEDDCEDGYFNLTKELLKLSEEEVDFLDKVFPHMELLKVFNDSL